MFYMYLLDDIDSFDTKLSQVCQKGLQPVCDHGGYDGALFCCISCLTPLFSKSSLIHSDSRIYSFKRPESMGLLNYSFDVSSVFPKTVLSCASCGQNLGFIQSSALGERKCFFAFAKSVFLEINGALCDLPVHSIHQL